MFIMGLNQEDLSPLFRIVSATLLFGNMKFKQDRNSDQATLPDNTVAQKIAHLLGLSVTDMTKAFLKPRIKVGRDYVTKAQTKEQVHISLDLLVMTLVLIILMLDNRLSLPWKQFQRPATSACSVGW
jgi:myosin protein heavy chain